MIFCKWTIQISEGVVSIHIDGNRACVATKGTAGRTWFGKRHWDPFFSAECTGEKCLWQETQDVAALCFANAIVWPSRRQQGSSLATWFAFRHRSTEKRTKCFGQHSQINNSTEFTERQDRNISLTQLSRQRAKHASRVPEPACSIRMWTWKMKEIEERCL